MSLIYFRFFIIITSWKRVGPFVRTNLISLHTRMLCVKFSEFGLVVLEEILNFANEFPLFRYCLFLEKGGVLHLKKEHLEFTSPKDALCQVWLKLAQWFWRRSFKFWFFFRYFVIISPWKKGGVLLTQDAFCQVWLKLALWFGVSRFKHFVKVWRALGF